MAPQTSAHGVSAVPEGGRQAVILHYLDVIRRRFWIILSLAVIFGTVGAIQSYNTPVLYRATAKILVEFQAPSVLNFDREGGEQHWDPGFFRTQAELMRSRVVLEDVLKDPFVAEFMARGSAPSRPSLLSELKRTIRAALGGEPDAPSEPWMDLREKINCVHLGESRFINVDVQDHDPWAAAKIANVVALVFRDYHKKQKVVQLGESFKLLQSQRDKEEAELLKAEQALHRFRESAQGVSVSPTAQEQPSINRLVKLNEQLTSVQLERIELSSQIGVMKQALEKGITSNDALNRQLFSIPVIETDGSLSKLRGELAEAQKKVAMLGQTYGSAHPRIKEAEANAALLLEQFKTKLQELVLAHDNRLQMLSDEEDELKRTYDEQRKLAIDLSKESFEYTRLKAAVDRHRSLFDSIVDRMREVDVSSGLARTNVQIADEASVPTTPSTPGKMRRIFAALFLGTLFGGALAFLFENLDDTIKTPEDLRERLNVPLLGFVPSMDQEESFEPGSEEEAEARKAKPVKRRKTSVSQWVIREFFPFVDVKEERAPAAERAKKGRFVALESMSSVAEAYRNLRANLFYSTPVDEVKVIAMTSSRPQEGKTTASCNLAISVALAGKKTLLVDADLHRPSIGVALDLEKRNGLTSALVGEARWQDSVTELNVKGRRIENLDVLLSGPTTPNPSELLQSERMRQLIAEFREAYDWVIIDTPPILFVSDASILGVMCDGVVLVVKAGTSTRSLLSRTTEQLQNVQARLVGAILNNVIVSRMGRHYSSYYNYGYSRYARDYKETYYRRESSDTSKETARADSDSSTKGSGALDRARKLFVGGKLNDVIDLLFPHVTSNPRDCDAWAVLLKALVRLKDSSGLSRAVAALREAEGVPTHLYNLARGHLAMARGNHEGARRWYEDALKAEPDSVAVLESLCFAEALRGRVEEAKKHAGRLAQLDPGNAQSCHVFGYLALMSGDTDKAIEWLQQSNTAEVQPAVMNDLALLHLGRGELEVAEKHARQSVEVRPSESVSWDVLAAVLAKEGRWVEAEEATEQALLLSSDDPRMLLRMAEVQVGRQNLARARDLLDQLSEHSVTFSDADRARVEQVRKAVG